MGEGRYLCWVTPPWRNESSRNTYQPPFPSTWPLASVPWTGGGIGRPALSPATPMTRTRRLHPLLIGIAAIAGALLLPVGASAAGARCDYRNMLDAAANGR